jgi:hypothetical protein
MYSFPNARSTHTSQRILPCVRPLTAISETTGVVLIPTASLPHRLMGMQYGELSELFVHNFPLGSSPNSHSTVRHLQGQLVSERVLASLLFGLCLERLCGRYFIQHLSLLTLGCNARNECQTRNIVRARSVCCRFGTVLQSLAWTSANWHVQILNHSDAHFVWAAHMLTGARECLHGRTCDRNGLVFSDAFAPPPHMALSYCICCFLS